MNRLSVTLISRKAESRLGTSDLSDVVVGLLSSRDQGDDISQVGLEAIDLVDLEEQKLLRLLGQTESDEPSKHYSSLSEKENIQHIALDVGKTERCDRHLARIRLSE